jgi:hypothetical protein
VVVCGAQESTAKYCSHLLVDYLVLAVLPLSASTWAEGGEGEWDGKGPGLLDEAPAAALRLGACALYGACSPLEVTRQLLQERSCRETAGLLRGSVWARWHQ